MAELDELRVREKEMQAELDKYFKKNEDLYV